MARLPAWVWAGGLIGTAMGLLTFRAVPRIGVATFPVAVVCGQSVAALAFDHIGRSEWNSGGLACPTLRESSSCGERQIDQSDRFV
jgi:uncharacterized membrane protein YdcZ (DUF606 family)